MNRTFSFTVPVGPSHTGHLRETLLSLRHQDVHVQVALCDAGDSDKCRELADEFSDIIVYRRHGPDQGQSQAINEGWEALDGDVYSWLNADDVLAPDALRKVDNLFDANESAHVVYGQSLITGEDNLILGLHPAVSAQITDLTRSNVISQPSCFYRSEALDRFGMLREDLHYAMDWELWIRFYKAGLSFVYTPETLSSVLWERGTKTSSKSWTRMNEIRKMTSDTHSAYTVFKTMIGFYLHYLFEYSSLSGLLERGGVKGEQLWAPRNFASVQSGVFLTLFHFTEVSQCELCIDFAKPATVKLTFAGHSVDLVQRSKINLMIKHPAACLEVLTLEGAEFDPRTIRKMMLIPVVS